MITISTTDCRIRLPPFSPLTAVALWLVLCYNTNDVVLVPQCDVCKSLPSQLHLLPLGYRSISMDFILISVFLPRNSVAVWLLTDLLLSQSAIFTFRFPLGLIWVEVDHLNPTYPLAKEEFIMQPLRTHSWRYIPRLHPRWPQRRQWRSTISP